MSTKIPLDNYDNLSTKIESKIEKDEDFFRLFRWLGFLSTSKVKWKSYIGFSILTLITMAAVTEMICVIFHTIYYCKFSVKYASYPTYCGWDSQLTLNLVLFYYSQYKCTFTNNDEFAEILRIPGSCRVIRNVKLIVVAIGLKAVVFSVVILVATHFNSAESVVFNYNDIFENFIIAMCVRLLAYYKMIAIITTQFYFLGFTGILCAAFNDLNMKFEKTIKDATNLSTENIAKIIHSFFLDHLRLSKKLRLLDGTYGICVLMYFICIIPSMVFALWAKIITFMEKLLDSYYLAMLQSATKVHYLVTELELAVALTWLVLLIANPIRIRTTVHNTKVLLLSNMEIWQEYDSKISDVARLFLTHLNEDQLGISIYGFVLITKPLILSIISISATLLIFLVQSHNGYSSVTTHLIQQMPSIGIH